ncbi:hypothetical protein [Vreelandella neptunia]|uniref:Uncharacterized protein n=1 Tax=Vreelandella neptunia TaxID=115551 RepID=A0ABZ0YP50_9GAMM|nr:hypothetical protein [Halomonas neptunia]MDN3558922.1 hypothetical protein [Halomonas neptunia]WQH13887.1 hypothetical protein SR894_04915 [Halomonas neptunia]
MRDFSLLIPVIVMLSMLTQIIRNPLRHTLARVLNGQAWFLQRIGSMQRLNGCSNTLPLSTISFKTTKAPRKKDK